MPIEEEFHRFSSPCTTFQHCNDYFWISHCEINVNVVLVPYEYSQTCVIRTLLIRHFHLICGGNLKTLKPLLLTTNNIKSTF